ncbi:ankyrin repeat and MYND domain-containing protein 1 isoform X3 [Pseudoliparis swirei]|uniref:ankyrin repeat and MYND domain-containing protein 1 isoform X3 n=1 Tax=Pseudoliparis swirei TaxID=2059687 RepID=UPI0024BE8FC1|nr:ankyrin repeat and MYND domain-containing protein 1 isoform X3 [Pseudoliparis swirei]
MLSTFDGVAAAPGRGAAEPGTVRRSDGHRGAPGLGVQEWPDGSTYEGGFVNGYKHGKGRYTWSNGEFYEGSFYKDYRHGGGLYCWPTGHTFTGKFYLNRKEGYGQQMLPEGATFKGLYHTDQRFGPGVVGHPDGREDVGLWLGERLLRLCTSVEEGFSLKNFHEYAAYMDPAVITMSMTQVQPPTSVLQSEARADSEVDTERDLLSDDFILPPGMESYSTDGDHLPLPPGRRKELDQHFDGELWEPDAYSYQGYKRDPLAPLPLQPRMLAHMHKHRLQAGIVGWDVASVLALNRDSFGPKGPLEVSSELLIQHASRGELQTVSQILQTGLVHCDVTDSQGHSALIAATVNCHNDVIQLLLDMGADVDKLNCEGMSALAVCHVLYYPFQSLHTTSTETPSKTQGFRSPFGCGISPQISHMDFTTDTPRTAEKQTEHISHHSSKVSNEFWAGINEPETPADAGDPQEERNEKEGEGEGRGCKEMRREGKVGEKEESSRGVDENEIKEEESETKSRCDQTWENGESQLKEMEREFKMGERVEEDVEERVQNNHEEDVKEKEERGVERLIQVLDGHIALGGVQWKECRAEAAGRVQGKDKEPTPKATFDSACSVSSYNIQVTEDLMQRSAEALSRTGFPQRSDTQETVRKMAAMKIEHRVRWTTLKLLLERGADPNASRVPMPVLFLAIMAADTEAVRRLLLCGARTNIPLPAERKGLHPLHVAAALPGPAGPRITELLLHAVTDPDARACDQNEICERDTVCVFLSFKPETLVVIFKVRVELERKGFQSQMFFVVVFLQFVMKAQESVNTSKNPQVKEGGRTALHMACQRDSDYRNASKVVALLLSHRARTDFLWSGHSPLSLAIASGNDLAVEELLNGGADPNIPLGRGVGSALCALANVNYHLGGNRAKLLDTLAKAGADILMPVMVGDVVGTAVDYAHFSFNQDSRIANTPFHVLNMRERETYTARRQLLSMMGDLLRKIAGQREKEHLEREQRLTLKITGTSNTERCVYTEADAISSNMLLPSCESLSPITEKQRKPVIKFCYQCGRSVSVKLTACSRCRKVFYCSRTCQLKAWDERHKGECIRVTADGLQKSVAFQSPRGPGPLPVTWKSHTHNRPLGVKLKFHRPLKPMGVAEEVLESQVYLSENYSGN